MRQRSQRPVPALLPATAADPLPNTLALLERRHCGAGGEQQKYRLVVNNTELDASLDEAAASQIQACYLDERDVEIRGVLVEWSRFAFVVGEDGDNF